jgi:hypothetical protein
LSEDKYKPKRNHVASEPLPEIESKELKLLKKIAAKLGVEA